MLGEREETEIFERGGLPTAPTKYSFVDDDDEAVLIVMGWLADETEVAGTEAEARDEAELENDGGNAVRLANVEGTPVAAAPVLELIAAAASAAAKIFLILSLLTCFPHLFVE